MTVRERLAHPLRALRAAAAVPTRRLALVLALLAPLWLASSTRVGTIIAWTAVVLVLAAVTLDIASLPSQRDLDVAREFPETVGVGDRVEGSYRLVSRWGRRVFATLFDAIPGAFLSGSQPFTTVELGPQTAVDTALRSVQADR